MLRTKTTSRMNSANKTSTLLPSAGTAIPERERGYFENRLGSNFANVRVHNDEGAALQAASLGAKAFTIGNDIFFSRGRYQPGTTAGDHLLAHELTHVVQQNQPAPASADVEPRARAAADRVSEGKDVSAESLGSAETGIHCQDDEEKQKSPLPSPLPRLQLDPTLIPPDTWLTLQTSFQSHGLRLGPRDALDIESEWQRSSQILDTMGITDSFKLGFITKQFILQKGIESQVESLHARENPNALDIFNQQMKIAYPDAWQTPIFTIFSTDWLRKKK